MDFNFNDERPLFLQIAEQIENNIVNGVFEEETQIPSTTEVATLFKINPATVLKGMNILVDEGLVYKQRGIGMFVAKGAVNTIKEKRKNDFYQQYVEQLINEAKVLDISEEEIITMLKRGYGHE